MADTKKRQGPSIFGEVPSSRPVQQVQTPAQRQTQERQARRHGEFTQMVQQQGLLPATGEVIGEGAAVLGRAFAEDSERRQDFDKRRGEGQGEGTLGKFLFGPEYGNQAPVTEQDLQVQKAAEAAQVADQYMQGFEQEMNFVSRQFSLYDALDQEALPAHIQQALDESRQAALAEIDRIDSQIQNVEASMHLYDVLMNPENLASPSELATAGFPSDNPMGNALTHLAARMGMTPGAAATANQEQLYDFAEQGEQLVQGAADGEVDQERVNEFAAEAAATVAGNQVMSAQQQFAFNVAAQNSINDLVESRKAIQNEFESIETSLENEANAQQEGKFLMSYNPTPQGAYDEAYVSVVSDVLDSADLNLSQRQEEALLESIMPFADYLDTAFENEQSMAQIDAKLQEVSTATGVDKTVLKDAIMNARNTARTAQQEIEDLPRKQRFNPGSQGMAYLVYQAAEEEVGDEAARMLANSPSMHTLLSTVSSGRAGFESRNGSMAGMGGLPREAYTAMGIDYDQIKGDPIEEAKAMVRYVNVVYGGDAAAALKDFRDNQSWGTRLEPQE